jgi:hypothetical protein
VLGGQDLNGGRGVFLEVLYISDLSVDIKSQSFIGMSEEILRISMSYLGNFNPAEPCTHPQKKA